MTFLDTSAIYALSDQTDARHELSRKRLAGLVQSGERLLTHNYVLLESLALLQHRLGLEAATTLGESAPQFDIAWVDEDLHFEAVRAMKRSGKRHVSLVDHVSFLVMSSRGLVTAFAFDPHFEAEGFRLYA